MKPSFPEWFRHALQCAAERALSVGMGSIVRAISAKPTYLFGLVSVAATLLVTSLPAASAVYYRITDLGLSSGPTGINDAGEVVGFGDNGSGYRAFRWTPGGGVQYLSGLLVGSAGFAYGINNAGQIIGEGTSTRLGTRPFRWTPGIGFLDLGGLPGHHSHVYGINNAGEVAGSVTINIAGAQRAVRWLADGTRQDLGFLPGGGDFSAANAINNAGQLAGAGDVGNTSHAFLWSATGGMQDLDDLRGGAANSAATGINDLGQVTGVSDNHAFLWTAGSGMQDLGDLPGGEDNSIANGINNAGQVVGAGGGAGPVAFLWTAAGGMQDLNALIDPHDPHKGRIQLESATDINNAGQIVASGRDFAFPGGRAYLLTPVPEPDTWALLLVGLSLTAMMVKRRASRTSSFRLTAINDTRSATRLEALPD